MSGIVRTMSKGPQDRRSRDFLLRGLPQEVAEKLKVAASLHRVSMKDYIRGVLETHLHELEQQGFKLTLTEPELGHAGAYYMLPDVLQRSKSPKGQKKG
jgi:plasmid stability protein